MDWYVDRERAGIKATTKEGEWRVQYIPNEQWKKQHNCQ